MSVPGQPGANIKRYEKILINTHALSTFCGAFTGNFEEMVDFFEVYLFLDAFLG